MTTSRYLVAQGNLRPYRDHLNRVLCLEVGTSKRSEASMAETMEPTMDAGAEQGGEATPRSGG
jgi:hypothetical protein